MARDENSEHAKEGLQRWASSYWRPLYLYLRKRGERHDEACDLVQGFFEFVLDSGFLAHVEREGGKFRSYLLKSLERWRSRQRTRALAQKRGGTAVHVPLEGIEHVRVEAELEDHFSPEEAYDRRWAADIVASAAAAIQGDYERRGRGLWFATLQAALPGGGGLAPYGELARTLGASEGAIKKAVFDLRASFTARLREEIRATVRSNEDAEEELRHLVAVLARRSGDSPLSQ